MSLLLVVVLLFFSSSCSVSSGQYYVSDDCSSVTQSPCNPLSVYAGNMSQYNNTIFYFIGTSVINFTVTMDSVQNITLHGLDQSPTIYCILNDYYQGNNFITVTTSSHVSFSSISFLKCYIHLSFSSNITITGSTMTFEKLRYFIDTNSSVTLLNVFDCKIVSSTFNNVPPPTIEYDPPPVCYNELRHYSLTLTNVTVTNGFGSLSINMKHGTSYNISVVIDNVKSISTKGIDLSFSESLFSLHIINSSVSRCNPGTGFLFYFDTYSWISKNCNIKGVEPKSTIVIEDSQFYKNYEGLSLYFHKLNIHHIAVTVRSCSIRDNNGYGLLINGHLSTSICISVIDTELVRNWRNEILFCLSIFLKLSNITVTNTLAIGLEITSSVVTVENRLVFENNTGVVGGGMAIKGSSVVVLSPSANLEFIDNHASLVGGGIYIDENSKFQFKQNSCFIPLTLKDNTAGVAGNDIYGSNFSFNYFNLTNAKASVSSNFRFFFCDPNSNETIPSDTESNGTTSSTQNHDKYEQQIFRGQPLKYNVAFFVFNLDTVASTIDFAPTNGTVLIGIDKLPMTQVSITGNCSLIKYISYNLTYTRHEIILEILNYYYRIQTQFILHDCPIGFSVNSSGVCDCIAPRENVTCDIDSQSIIHNGLLWIGTYDTSTPFNANETNPNTCIINEDCLLYCSPNPVTFQLNDTDTQCVDNKGGRMCGSCRDGYSLLMGSNKCGQCHNNYMMIAWIALFAVMGVLLVVLLIALNLTVSVGTLNGLLFYANIVKLYEPVFSRKGALPVLSQVISWINLDFGFEICFYNGMDSYAKQWLQFAFPLYLWIIIIIIIQLCRRYGKISRLMGSHVVPVLSTLTFLSYTKLVRTIVIVLHKHEVTLHCANESVKSVSLWYEDPNVEYAKGKHAGLLGFALLVSVFFVIPYTLFLLCHPVLEKHLSHFKLFKSWSHFKPIIDAYSGPMKDDYRFWPGLLLVTRIPLLLIVTFLQNESRVLLLAVATIILSLSFIFGGVYRRKLNNIIEFWFLLNLCIMASLSVAFTDDSKKLFKKQDEDDDDQDVTKSHKTVDQQMREIVPSSTNVKLSNDNRINTTRAMPINEHIRNKINVEDSISSIAPLIYNSEYDTATAANPTNADLVKRTNTTPLPPAAQTVIYDKVTGDINK
uniref:Right handed beta helix domain-containing protein n=1 Tax=Amphimedon queenslandica TaxID=400682 RepID=A0A1X7U1L3_AMPQE